MTLHFSYLCMIKRGKTPFSVLPHLRIQSEIKLPAVQSLTVNFACMKASLQLHCMATYLLNIIVFFSHTSKWDQNKCHICNNGLVITQTVDFKCHIIKQHGFSDDSDNCMKCEGTEIGLYRLMTYQEDLKFLTGIVLVFSFIESLYKYQHLYQS